MSTSTVFSGRTAIITECPETMTNCPSSQKTSHVTTETVLVSKIIVPVIATGAHVSASSPSSSPSSNSGRALVQTLTRTFLDLVLTLDQAAPRLLLLLTASPVTMSRRSYHSPSFRLQLPCYQFRVAPLCRGHPAQALHLFSLLASQLHSLRLSLTALHPLRPFRLLCRSRSLPLLPRISCRRCILTL